MVGITSMSLQSMMLTLVLEALYFTLLLDMVPSFPQPEPTITAPPPSVTSYACQLPNSFNNGRCGRVAQSDCKLAIAKFNPTAHYAQNTVFTSFKAFTAGYGCAANFICSEGYPTPGMTGLEIQDVFNSIYTSNTTQTSSGTKSTACGQNGKCGNAYFNNGCYVSLSSCASCR